nr:MAG TPA: hypothetical protein [Caudoviricetes sp.]
MANLRKLLLHLTQISIYLQLKDILIFSYLL